jgi:hypothetical protein
MVKRHNSALHWVAEDRNVSYQNKVGYKENKRKEMEAEEWEGIRKKKVKVRQIGT